MKDGDKIAKLKEWVVMKKKKRYFMGGQVYEVLNELEEMLKDDK